MSLKEYRKKRNFQKTPEPSGDGPQKKSGSFFMVHCHDASHLHFDLRIQVGDTLKSWALPKGPSMNPSDKVLAVFVEDHPVDYGDFEGTIPPGNYGAGTLLIWDQGTYQERSSPPAHRLAAVMEEALSRGHITLILSGQRLKGEFALIRMKASKNWLFVKAWDEYATTKSSPLPLTSIRSGRDFSAVKQEASNWTSPASPPAPKKIVYPKLPFVEGQVRSLQSGENFKLMIPAQRQQLGEQEGWLRHGWREGTHGLLVVHNYKYSLRSKHNRDLTKTFSQRLKHLPTPYAQAVLDIIIGPQELYLVDVLSCHQQVFVDRNFASRQAVVEEVILAYEGHLKALPPWQETNPCLQRHLGSPYRPGVQNFALVTSQTSVPPDPPQRVSPSRQDLRPPLPEPTASPAWIYRGPVRVTHPDKILWEQEGYTKRDLLLYLQHIYPVIAPHIAGAPLALVRFPHGISGQGFFQKDFAGYHPKFLRIEGISSRSSGKTIQYAICEGIDALLYLGNLSAIELNPWMSALPDLDRPRLVYIDIDPNGREMPDIITVVRACRQVLEDIGAVFGLKSSGSKGFHIGIPMGQRYSYEDARNLCLRICQIVVGRLPHLCTLETKPALREGRIYLDCLQNRRGQTIVAPYSPRPLAGAPVSTPLHWEELTDDFRQEDFNMLRVIQRMRSMEDPWRPLLKAVNNLPHLLQKLDDMSRDQSPDKL